MNDPTSIIYRSPCASKKKIYLFYMRDSKHFIALKSPRAFFGFRYQCDDCSRMMHNINNHNCDNVCNYCRLSPLCPNTRQMIKCIHCNRSFKGESCFQRHKRPIVNTKTGVAESTCQQMCICNKCFKFVRIGNNQAHICSDKYCNVCRKMVPADHACHIQPYLKKPPKRWVIIFFDVEARQERIVINKSTAAVTDKKKRNTSEREYVHEANLCVASQVCVFCCCLFFLA